MSLARLSSAFASVFALVLASCPAQTTAAPAPTTEHDPRIAAILHSLEQVKYIRETELSPDGNLIAWNVDGNGITLAPLSNPTQTRHITACTGDQHGPEGSLAWSPDSKTLAFFSNCTPSAKVAIFADDVTASAAPRLLAQLDGYAEDLAYSPDGKLVSFLYVEGATRPSGALAAMKPPSGVIGVEGLEVQRIAAVDVNPSMPRTSWFITPAGLHVYEFSWSPDSSQLTYVAAAPPGENNWWVAKLYTQFLCLPPLECRTYPQPKSVFDPNITPGPLHGLQIAVPRFSPDGNRIAFIGGLMSDQGSTGGDIYTIRSTGGNLKNVTPDRPASPAWFEWLDEQQIGIAGVNNGQSHLFIYNIDTQEPSDEFNVTLPDSVGAGSLEMRVSVSNTNNIAFVRSSFSEPPEVWAGPINSMQQITHLNDALKPSWGRAESVNWTSAAGPSASATDSSASFHVQGWLLYPANYDPAKKYPLIVYVHGGPSAAVVPAWPSARFGAAPFSALGYFVLMPNPRGSFGEGERFTQANRKDFGYGDLRDILAGVDAVTAKFPVDPQRVGITGWSYGGFMSMFAVTQTTRFRAAVAGAGISDWQSYYGENSIDQWMIPFFGASVYDDPGVYAKSSAINFIKQVKTPTLVVVGDRDGECPAPQSFEFWHALRDQHVPTELVVYPDEGHGFVNPEHRIDVLQRALAWFDQYMH